MLGSAPCAPLPLRPVTPKVLRARATSLHLGGSTSGTAKTRTKRSLSIVRPRGPSLGPGLHFVLKSHKFLLHKFRFGPTNFARNFSHALPSQNAQILAKFRVCERALSFPSCGLCHTICRRSAHPFPEATPCLLTLPKICSSHHALVVLQHQRGLDHVR